VTTKHPTSNGYGRLPVDLPDPEVRPAPQRLVRSAAAKLRIVQEYESYPPGDPGRGALLRREGIYTSHISKWRKLRDRAALQALTPPPPGPPAAITDPLQQELARLRTENARLQARLTQAETVIEVQKKVAQLLGAGLPTQEATEP
jgi:transposase-like protein